MRQTKHAHAIARECICLRADDCQLRFGQATQLSNGFDGTFDIGPAAVAIGISDHIGNCQQFRAQAISTQERA